MSYHLRSRCHSLNGCCELKFPSPKPQKKRQRAKSNHCAVRSEDSTTDSDVSHSVDRLTALAKETVARVDRITAESSASLSQPGPIQTVKRVVLVSKEEEEDYASISNTHRLSGQHGAKPISILKRKSSQDEGCVTPPVTSSPSAPDQVSRKNGILKKSGGSLDESHLRRSCSPDVEASGSILKNGRSRRSSLEESTNKQSILKKKDGDGPHGILKKKNSIDNGSEFKHMSPHAANGEKTLQQDDEVKPILKKRSSEDYPIAEPSSSSDTPPRPILKKKSSTDTDEMDEWPKRTILKTSHRKSRDEDDEISEIFRRRSVGSPPLMEATGQTLAFCDNIEQSSDSEDELQPRASNSFSSVRPTSPSGPHSDFSSAWRRWDCNSSHGPQENRPGSPPPVSDGMTNIEGDFHSLGAIPKQPQLRSARISPQPSFSTSNRSVACLVQNIGNCSTSPPPRSPPPSPLPSPPVSSPESPLSTPPLSPQNCLPRPSSLVLSPESISIEESCTAFQNHIPSPVGPDDSWEARRHSTFLGATSCYLRSDQLGDNWILRNRSPSPVLQTDDRNSSGLTTSYSGQQEQLATDLANESGFGESSGSDFIASLDRSSGPLVSPVDQAGSSGNTNTVSLDKGEDVHEDSQVREQDIHQTELVESEMESEEENRGLQRSASKVSEKALLFSQMEEKMKQSAEEARAKRLPKADLNSGIARYRNRKAERAAEPNRFSTQPITVNELKGVKPSPNVTTSASETSLAQPGIKAARKRERCGSITDYIKFFDTMCFSKEVSLSKPNRSQSVCFSNEVIKDKLNTSPRFRRGLHFTTQPISVADVLAAKAFIKESGINEIDINEDENDPSKLSLAERVKLFNQAMTADRLPVMGAPAQSQSNRRRAPASRFKTQPVTIEEVSTAQKIIKQPPEELIGISSTKAAKELFEDAAKNLSKSVSSSRLVNTSRRDSHSESPKRGILKNTSSSLKEKHDSSDTDNDRVSSEQANQVPGPSKPSASVQCESGLDHIKKVLSVERVRHNNPSLKTHNVPKSDLRRASFESPSHSSSESDSECSSDSEDEENRGSIPSQEFSSKSQKEPQDKQPSSTVSKRPAQSENSDKVRNMKKNSQEKENLGGKTISGKHLKLKGITIQPQEAKKLVLKKLEVLNKPNVVTTQNISESKEAPNCSPNALSDDGDTSSGGQEVRRIISNDAVARRHQANLARQQAKKEREDERKEQERPRPGRLDAGLTQRLGLQLQLRLPGQAPPVPLSKSRSQHAALPQDSDEDADDEAAMAVQAGAVAGGLRRCLTQPMPVADQDVSGVSANASIAERLKLLQQNGQTGWRKRVVKPSTAEDVSKSISDSQQILKQLVSGNRNSMVAAESPTEVISLQRSGSGDRSSILADRLGKLENASQDWRKRIGQKDADQFSVKGKMRASSLSDAPSVKATPPSTPSTPLSPTPDLIPGSERKRNVPKPMRFCSKTGVRAHTFKRSMSAPNAEEDSDTSPSEQETSDASEQQNPTPQIRNQVQGPRIELPRLDEQFDSFFSTSINVGNQTIEINDIDLDSAVTRSSELLVQKRTVKVSGRRVASRNPIKALSARTDLCTEYVDVRTGAAEREMKRLCAEKLAKNSSLAVEALAGLASKEDFSAVSLRKSSSTSAVHNGTTLLPYKEIMLLQIKGRRHIQTRLVEPIASSINSGDNFVLVTPSQVFNWIGKYSNVIERARGAEIALHIQQNKDLGFSGASPVITISEEKTTCSSSQIATFWRLLGSLDGPKSLEAGHPDEDELYETAILETNMIYELKDAELVPSENYWGCIPRIEMLDPSKILVFDFGSEMYVWNGKNAPLDLRKTALQLSKELWEQGYDYSDCDICPLLSATSLGPQFGLKGEVGIKSAKRRPLWALIAKITQHMETILFREKFLDWPDFTRVIQAKDSSVKDKVVDASVYVEPCNAKDMLDSEPEDPDLLLEGFHLGRGNEFYDEETRRFYEIQTTGVKVWHIQEYEYSELPERSFGQFHSGDNYVVRWAYRVTVTTRALNGQPSKHAASQGRDRFCYFCWQGRKALLNDKGAAALLTVELDKEQGPQIFVTQGLEPPAFLGLFNGKMTIHSGRRGDQHSQKGTYRLFAIRGELEREASLVEVTPSMRQLRSRGCFLLLNEKSKILHIWCGARALPHNRNIAKTLALKIQKEMSEEFGLPSALEIQDEEEGSESQEFLKGFGGSNRHLYVSLPSAKDGNSQYSPRLFHLTSLSGTFTATEVAGPCRNSKLTVPFPFQQSHLYGASQPAVFILDNGDSLWLWQGWWLSERDEEDGNAVSGGEGLGSGAVRWQAERRAAMQTALDYWALRHPGQPPQAFLVWAGLEPFEFTNLFLEWTDRDDIAEINIQDGHKAGEILSVESELAKLTQSTYPAAQLLQRPLPDGVDPTRLELYLAPQHFQEMLGMSKEDFMELPQWKQTKLKKDAGLF
ncbi:supervillin isoform X3 [Thrips palmi]|uniref:Supervillin isoform X3 n=1 Tax=Thrips palmi TaxID=161013 RepID=A0A6P9A0B3_THRPL|nr:supervillin isoform X3 [Thrips palmi]